jgi:DNA repair exonuclease SbcCD ATPase subunit
MRNETNLRESQDLLDRLCQQQEEIHTAEQTLSQQCQEMGRLLRDLKHKYQGSHSHCLAELEVLRMGNECLQQMVAERDQQLGELNQRLADLPQPLPPLQDEACLIEMQGLREQLREREALIEQLQATPRQETLEPSFSEDRDYEAEVTEFRRQLEADRQELNEEIQQLRGRNAELNQVAREAELQLSRERAQLARERVELDRMREEIRQQLECIQRDAGLRERLAAVERLKGEVVERQRPPETGVGVSAPFARRKSGSSLTNWRALLSGSKAHTADV